MLLRYPGGMRPAPQQMPCPRCTAMVRPHATTHRIPVHRIRNEKGADECTFSNDYPPGFVPETPIRAPRRKQKALQA